MPNPPCSATTAAGRPCKENAMDGSRFCRAHDPDKPKRKSGPPIGNANAYKHGAFSKRRQAPDDWPDPKIMQLARDLDYTNQRLIARLEDNGNLSQLDPDALAKIVATVGQNASRIARLLRDQRAVSGQAADGIADAFARILDEITGEAGRE